MATAVSLPPESVVSDKVTLEEYLGTSYRPDCDFVDGLLEERNLGEEEHSELQIALGAWFYNRRLEWKIRVATEYRTRVSGTRVRIPDLSIYYDDGKREKIRTTPPLLCVEILSPDDRLPRIVRRLADFLMMGVENVWLFDPAERTVFTYTRFGLLLVDKTRLEIAGSPIYVDLPELFAQLDQTGVQNP